MEFCLQEDEFQCRSANYNPETGECVLNDVDRFTTTTPRGFQKAPNNQSEYFENNCIEGRNLNSIFIIKPFVMYKIQNSRWQLHFFVDYLRMCDFLKLDGRILKTVDAIFQNVSSLEGCRQMCLGGPLQCRTFDWGVTGEDVCRLSHHSAQTLTTIQEPYLDSPQTTTYELGSCYNSEYKANHFE